MKNYLLSKKCWSALLLLLLLNVSNDAFSQDYNSARITVLNGSSIPFYFNSIARLKNGIEISQGTKLGISLKTNNVVDHDLTGFILNFRSFNNQPDIKGDVYTLPLNKLRLKAENALGLDAGVSQNYVALTNNWLPLFIYEDLTWSTNLSWNTHQLNISYDCGIPESAGGNGALLGEEPDYYQVEIEIEIIPTGSGF